MKATTQITQKVRITGAISTVELLAFIRQTLAIPEGAQVIMNASDDQATVFLADIWPLSFTATWEEPAAATPERSIAMRAVVPVAIGEGIGE